jgi:hypothetical protein
MLGEVARDANMPCDKMIIVEIWRVLKYLILFNYIEMSN